MHRPGYSLARFVSHFSKTVIPGQPPCVNGCGTGCVPADDAPGVGGGVPGYWVVGTGTRVLGGGTGYWVLVLVLAWPVLVLAWPVLVLAWPVLVLAWPSLAVVLAWPSLAVVLAWPWLWCPYRDLR